MRHSSALGMIVIAGLSLADSTPAMSSPPEPTGFGMSLASGGDFDGDGKVDFLVGSPHFNGRDGEATLRSGADGHVLRTFEARSRFEGMGASVAIVGDVDGDGVPDLAVGAAQASRPPKGGVAEGEELAGRVTIFSGKDGKTLRDLWGQAHQQFGSAMAASPDLDGDGVPDLLVGAPIAQPKGVLDAGVVRAFSGKTGAQLFESEGERREVRLGEALTVLPDLNGDGVPDFAAGGPAGLDGAEVRVCSGKTGAVLRTLGPREGWKWFGQSLGGVGDLNGDGVGDLAIGVPGARGESGVLVGAVAVFSGKDGSLLRLIPGASRGEQFGSAVSGPGDLNGDGVPDVCVGVPRADAGALKHAGRLCAISGKDGTKLWDLAGNAEDMQLGSSLISVGDLDGDGVPDLVVGAPGSDRVWVVSGKKGSLVLAIADPGK